VRPSGRWADELAALAARGGDQLASGTPRKDVRVGDVTACLRRAWATETILATTAELAEGSEVIRLANSWGAVQAYYVLYGATQAVRVAEGVARPEAHEPTKKAFVDLWVTRSIDLPPWTFAQCTPSARLADTGGFLGGPGRALDLSLHAWSSWGPDACWDIAGKALHSTHQGRIDEQLRKASERKQGERRKAWKDEERQRLIEKLKPRVEPPWWNSKRRLTAADKAEVIANARPTTVMDYLWRLRIKANYEDQGMFSDGPETDSVAAKFAAHLVALTAASLLVHELRLRHLLGKEILLSAVDDWLGRHRTLGTGLALRRDLLDQ
jgi:hypothetical protein